MILYLLRHGDAVHTGGAITRDADRVLSDQGERDIQAVARLIESLDQPIHVLTSPLTRAIQTGEIVARGLKGNVIVRQTENLSPGFRQEALLEEISALEPGPVLAVGHQPDMSSFISHVIPDLTPLPMEPGAIARIDLSGFEADSGRLRWLIPPVLLHAMEKERS